MRSDGGQTPNQKPCREKTGHAYGDAERTPMSLPESPPHSTSTSSIWNPRKSCPLRALVLNSTTTRKGEVFRAQRRTSENVNLRASQHMIDIPVNKSVYNGYGGEQFSAKMQPKRTRGGKPKL